MTLAALLGLGLPAQDTSAQRSPDLVEVRDLRDLERAFVKIADQVRDSVVAVRTLASQTFFRPGPENIAEWTGMVPRGHGSGCIISHDGYIVTNTHVIEDADEIRVVLHNGEELPAQLVQADQRSDLAVLKIDRAGLRPVRFGSVSQVRQGQWCLAVGNPFGLSNLRGNPVLTIGNVSALNQDLSSELNEGVREDSGARRYYGAMIQTSAPINPGNSGGPLFNIDGDLIGIVTAIATNSGVTEGAGFAIPMSRMNRNIIDTLRRGELVKYGFLGVSIRDLNTEARRAAGMASHRGALVAEITKGGPAEKAAMKEGDVIVRFNGVDIKDMDHLVRTIGASPVGDPVEVIYYRKGQQQIARAQLVAREVAPVLAHSGGERDEPRTTRWRGIWLAEPTEQTLRRYGLDRSELGLLVLDVDLDSDSRNSGVRPRQWLLQVDRQNTYTIEQFLKAAERASANPRLRIREGDDTKTIDLGPPDRSM
jgi:serine protease Do